MTSVAPASASCGGRFRRVRRLGCAWRGVVASTCRGRCPHRPESRSLRAAGDSGPYNEEPTHSSTAEWKRAGEQPDSPVTASAPIRMIRPTRLRPFSGISKGGQPLDALFRPFLSHKRNGPVGDSPRPRRAGEKPAERPARRSGRDPSPRPAGRRDLPINRPGNPALTSSRPPGRSRSKDWCTPWQPSRPR